MVCALSRSLALDGPRILGSRLETSIDDDENDRLLNRGRGAVVPGWGLRGKLETEANLFVRVYTFCQTKGAKNV